MLLQSAIAAEGKVGLKMNVPKKALKDVGDLLPRAATPPPSRTCRTPIGWRWRSWPTKAT